MFMLDFVATAGAAMGLFGDKDEDKDKTEPAADAAEKVKAAAVDAGLDTTGIEFLVEGDTVKMTGDTTSQEAAEKLALAAGNIEGISKVQADVSVPDPREPVTHTVEKGDTLWGISTKTLGNGARYEEIFEANKPMLSHPDKIYPGQVLRIPA